MRCSIVALFASTAVAQTTYIAGSFQWAIWANGANPSTAVPAQCPADHPQRCDAISQPGFCCPAGNYCLNVNGAAGCCPNGQSCNGAVGAPPSTWQPSTTNYGTYVTTVLVPVPVTVPVTVPAAQPTTQTTYYVPTTTTNNGYNGYCSTLTVQGNGLPTTRAGQCGTILVVSEASVLVKRTLVGFVMSISFVLGVILLIG